MTLEERLLLRNLLERLDADAAAERSVLRGQISDRERNALRSLLDHAESTAPGVLQQSAATPTPQVAVSEFALNTAVLQFESPQNPNWTLCLDFGTAKSKAFAANGDDPPQLEPLPLGEADEDLDQSVHDMSSSVWIADDGLLFLGSEAVKRGDSGDPLSRTRLDSLKQVISRVHALEGADSLQARLPTDVDPTATLTYLEAITIYLAYLTDLATTALEERSLPRYVRRTFTVPWWTMQQRRWTGDLLSTALIRGQLLADTFHGRWREGIQVQDVKKAVNAAAPYDEKLSWMLADQSRYGILEALAAASARLWTDRAARDVMLVVDVGAGTTDVSLFLVVQKDGEFHRSWPIAPGGVAIRQAGDTLDSLLVVEIMKRAALGEDKTLREQVSRGLNRDARRLKETMFKTGKVTAGLVNDDAVTMTAGEFLKLSGTQKFEGLVVDRIQKLLDEVDGSWVKAVSDRITLVLTGGGAGLPMIGDLAKRSWKLGNRSVRCRLAPEVPDFVRERFDTDFVQEYPRLAVSMGGALRMRLDEKGALKTFEGGTPPPGGLDSFPTRGE